MTTETDAPHAAAHPPGVSLYLAWAAFQRRPAAMAPAAGFDCVFLPLAYKGPNHLLRAWHYLRLCVTTLRLLRQRRPAVLWLQLPQVPLLWTALLYRLSCHRRCGCGLDARTSEVTSACPSFASFAPLLP